MKAMLFLLFLGCMLYFQPTASEYVRGCYYTDWSQHRSKSATFLPEDIDPFLCTHVLFAFALINRTTHTLTIKENNDHDLYRRINALKKIIPDR